MNGKRRAQRFGVEKPARITGRALRVERPCNVLDLRVSDLMAELEAGAVRIAAKVLGSATQQRR